jgi:hypothetical protein
LTSKSFGPGAMAWSNVVRTQTTSSFAKPSSSATAYATAASKPWPDSGASSCTHG